MSCPEATCPYVIGRWKGEYWRTASVAAFFTAFAASRNNFVSHNEPERTCNSFYIKRETSKLQKHFNQQVKQLIRKKVTLDRGAKKLKHAQQHTKVNYIRGKKYRLKQIYWVSPPSSTISSWSSNLASSSTERDLAAGFSGLLCRDAGESREHCWKQGYWFIYSTTILLQAVAWLVQPCVTSSF